MEWIEGVRSLDEQCFSSVDPLFLSLQEHSSVEAICSIKMPKQMVDIFQVKRYH